MSQGSERNSGDRKKGSHAEGAHRSQDTNYEVGYGKPPKNARFIKGKSGNPKGRPKKAVKKSGRQRFRDGNLDRILEEEAFRELKLQENGKPIAMSASQAIVRSILIDGMKGNRLAKKFAFELLRKEEREARKQATEQYEYLAKKKAEGEAMIAKCKEQDVPPPRLFPHPDDILLDEAKLKAYVIGPLSENAAIPHERGALTRDLFFARSVFDEKYSKVKNIEIEGMSASIWDLAAHASNDGLPPSFRRNDSSIISFHMELQWLTKKQLRQRIKTLEGQIAAFPDSVEEQLAARER
ncbi:MAG: DUF5681 domain-containing protein, partial [Rhodospirillales bacterium]